MINTDEEHKNVSLQQSLENEEIETTRKKQSHIGSVCIGSQEKWI
jgi:hypothetical protein